MNALRGLVGGNSGPTYDAYMRKLAEMSAPGMQERLAQEQIEMLGRKCRGFQKFSSEEFTEALEALDMKTQTVPFIALLFAKINKDYEEQRGDIRHAVHIAAKKFPEMNASDARFMTTPFLILMNLLVQMVDRMSQKDDKAKTLQAVANGLIAFDGGENKITEVHPQFFNMCSRHKLGEIARDVVRKDARDFIVRNDGDSDPCALAFNYFFMAANLHFSMQSFRQALHLYLTTLMVPMESLHSQHIIVYKRFVLLNFILGNAIKELPNCVQNMVSQSLGPQVSEYNELISLASRKDYTFDNASAVRKHIAQKGMTFENDRNGLLVQLVCQRVYQEAVMRVARTFKVITLEQVQKRAFLKNQKETIQLLEELVEGGRLQIDCIEETGFLTFTIPETKRPNAAVLAAAQKKVLNLKDIVSAEHDIVRCSKQYIRRMDKGQQDQGFPMFE